MTSKYRRFAAFGWQAFEIDGHRFDHILDAFERALKVKGQPAAIVARTLKGKGVSFVEDKNGWHGKPVPKEDLERALQELPLEEGNLKFQISAPAPAPPPADPPTARMAPPAYQLGQQVATREAYGAALKKLAAVDPRVVVLDGDVKNSTFAEVFAQACPERFFECFIAEQNMEVGHG